MTDVYSASFYANQRDGSLQSAQAMLPLLLEIFRPQSILDIGCGQGTWSKSAMQLGVGDVVGVDGDWARAVLTIPQASFRSFDVAAPFDLGRKFDLVISMEVAEHIDARHAVTFIDNLARHSDAVAFSAAIPFQGGTHHVNEQWPSYWVDAFRAHDYRCFDFLRWRTWNDRRIATWYRQNLLIFANTRATSLITRLETLASEPTTAGLNVVHPEMWNATMRSKALRLQRAISPVSQFIVRCVSRPRGGPENRQRESAFGSSAE